jgi:glucan endo-1,3-beta-D-glucosidase
MRSSGLLALAASLSTSTAVFQGFNYGSTKSDGVTVRSQADFQNLFQTAKNLVGTSGFTSARLYTMIQGGSSTNEPTQAIPAAIAEDTSLLLGLWASGGQDGINAEITALKSAISQYGTAFTSLVAGISVGSEDLYRISPTGIAAKSGYGADPATLASYISQVRTAIAGTPLSGASIGHVDTWTAWVNGSNQAVIDACDWIGMDAYPYFQTTQSNSIQNGPGLFQDALSATQAAVAGKPVWVTETGWPVSGSTANLAVPNTANAKTYWDAVGCPLFGKTNTWWYTLTDNDAVQTNPSFGIVPGNPLSTTPYFDLSCSAVSSSSSSPPSSTTSTGNSASSVISSSASSVISVPTNSVLASSGGGLSPSQGAGNGIGNSGASGTGAAPTGTGSAGTGSGSNSTATLKTTASPTGSSTTSLATATANAASHLAGSVVGAIGALIVAVAAL